MKEKKTVYEALKLFTASLKNIFRLVMRRKKNVKMPGKKSKEKKKKLKWKKKICKLLE